MGCVLSLWGPEHCPDYAVDRGSVGGRTAVECRAGGAFATVGFLLNNRGSFWYSEVVMRVERWRRALFSDLNKYKQGRVVRLARRAVKSLAFSQVVENNLRRE